MIFFFAAIKFSTYGVSNEKKNIWLKIHKISSKYFCWYIMNVDFPSFGSNSSFLEIQFFW